MRKGEIRKKQILQCAQHIFSEKGYYETQIADIVDLARVAKGTIYQYFKSKEELFATILEKFMKEWEQEISLNINDFKSDQASLELAQKFAKHRISKSLLFLKENPERSKIILRMGVGVNPEFEKIFLNFEEKLVNFIVKDIEIGKKNGHIDESINSEIAANALIGSVLRIGYYYFVLKNEDSYDINEINNEVVRIVLNTLGMS